MALKNEYIEYDESLHKMWLEGSSDEQPTVLDIIKHAFDRNYLASNINIGYDSMQSVFRFNGKIKKLKVDSETQQTYLTYLVETKTRLIIELGNIDNELLKFT